MTTYRVVFAYSVEIDAESERDAEDQAWTMFGQADPSNPDDFGCHVEQIVCDCGCQTVLEDSDGMCNACHVEHWAKWCEECGADPEDPCAEDCPNKKGENQ